MESDEKLISIIVPVYNTKTYLKECIDSILNQKYKNIQVIIVDDGSTDGCREICDEYAKIDSRVDVLHTVNGGSVRARKEGLRIARGSYTGFVDSDDYIEIDMFYQLVEVMENTGADFVHSGYNEILNYSQIECINFDNELFVLNEESQNRFFIKRFLLNIKDGKTISYSIWSKLFRTELIKKCFNKVSDKQMFGEDAICLFHCIFESKRIAFAPIARYNYRIREESLSHLENEELFNRQVMLCGEILKVLEDYDCLRALKNDINNFLISSLFAIKKTDKHRPFKLTQFYLDDIEMFRGKSVVIYGAGNVGEDLCEQLMIEKIDVRCIVDANPRRKQINGVEIETPSHLSFNLYDFVLIAVLNKTVADEIREQLAGMGIVKDSIIWIKPKKYF